MKASRVMLSVGAAVLVLAFVPSRVVVAPEWNLTVTDETGTPMSGITLQQASQDYSLESRPELLTMVSDAHGRVVFPMRVRYASRARRFYGCVQQWRIYAYEASCGPHTWVSIRYPQGYGENNEREYGESTLRYDGQGPSRVTRALVLHQCRSGGTGIACLSRP